jgi:hypothetical protein
MMGMFLARLEHMKMFSLDEEMVLFRPLYEFVHNHLLLLWSTTSYNDNHLGGSAWDSHQVR